MLAKHDTAKVIQGIEQMKVNHNYGPVRFFHAGEIRLEKSMCLLHYPTFSQNYAICQLSKFHFFPYGTGRKGNSQQQQG
jgi:hypothetical protein